MARTYAGNLSDPTAAPSIRNPDISTAAAAPAPTAPTRIRMPWEAAVGQSADQLAAAGTPNPGAVSSTPQQTTPSYTNPFGSTSPFMSSVTATDMMGNTQDFANGGQNSNYLTSDAAKQIAQMFGGNAVSQNTGMLQGGNVSSPMYGLDMGAGDVQDMGWVATALQRGDRLEDIQARMQAGINPPGGMAQRQSPEYMGNQWNMNSPISTNLPQGGISSMAGGNAGIPTNSMFSGIKASTHLGPQGGGKPTPFGPAGPQPGMGQQFGMQNFQQQPQQHFGFPGQGGQFPGQGGFNPFQQPGNMQGFMQFLQQFMQRQGQGIGPQQQMGPQRRPALQGNASVRNRLPNSNYFPTFR